MNDTPDNDELNKVLAQVEQALNDANLSDPNSREAVISGVKEAFDAVSKMPLSDFFNGNWEPPTPSHPDSNPSVVVLDGGRSSENNDSTEDEEPETSPPELRIIPGDSGKKSSDSSGFSPDVQVRILSSGDLAEFTDSSRAPMVIPGRIHLSSDPLGKGSQSQTIYRGTNTQCYRITCEEGMLSVVVSGEKMDTLGSGQSVDVEGALIQVESSGEPTTSGLFVRVN